MKTMYRTRTYSPFVGLALEDIDLSGRTRRERND